MFLVPQTLRGVCSCQTRSRSKTLVCSGLCSVLAPGCNWRRQWGRSALVSLTMMSGRSEIAVAPACNHAMPPAAHKGNCRLRPSSAGTARPLRSERMPGSAARRARLEGARPVPAAGARAHAQLEAALRVVPVEGRARARRQLPHRAAAVLPVLQRLVARVVQHVARRHGHHLRAVCRAACCTCGIAPA